MSRKTDKEVLDIHRKIVESMLKVEKLLVEETNSAGLDKRQNFLFVSRVINLVFQRHYEMCMSAAVDSLKEQENENKN